MKRFFLFAVALSLASVAMTVKPAEACAPNACNVATCNSACVASGADAGICANNGPGGCPICRCIY